MQRCGSGHRHAGAGLPPDQRRTGGGFSRRQLEEGDWHQRWNLWRGLRCELLLWNVSSVITFPYLRNYYTLWTKVLGHLLVIGFRWIIQCIKSSTLQSALKTIVTEWVVPKSTVNLSVALKSDATAATSQFVKFTVTERGGRWVLRHMVCKRGRRSADPLTAEFQTSSSINISTKNCALGVSWHGFPWPSSWGCFPRAGLDPLVTVQGHLHASVYKDIWDNSMLPT